MKNFLQFIFIISFFTTALLAGMAYLGQKSSRLKEFPHLLELSLALFVHALAYFVFGARPELLALSMLGWPWALRSMRPLLEDVAKEELARRWHVPLLVMGGLLSTVSYFLGMGFIITTAPFAAAFGAVGLSQIASSFQHEGRFSGLQKSVIFSVAAFYVTCLTFPIWGTYSMTVGLTADLLAIMAITVSALTESAELTKEQLSLETVEAERARTEKLVKNSKYSELGMMAAGIAHEINNPLAVIQARTTQLLRLYRDPKRQQELADGLQQILYTSERINRTIQGVREFVHDQGADGAEVRLKELIDDVLAFCGQRMKNHGVNLRFYNIDEFSIWGNKIQFEQILLNLLNNSFDAIEFLSDKWIEVSAQSNGDLLKIFVKDSGHGIPPHVAAHIMEPFYSTKEVGKGTGLGLALARGIAEKHGGRLSYMEGTGHTTFLLELPRTPPSTWSYPMVH